MSGQYRFGYHPDLLTQFPSLAAGLAFAKGIDNTSQSPEVRNLLRSQQDVIKAKYASEPISSHRHISSWRAAYSSLGVKPTQYRCAAEALLRHVLKSGTAPSINKLVDICNYVSLKHVLPVAAYDLGSISGPVEVRFAQGDELFQPLHVKETEYPKPGEVVYVDDAGALSRRWNWRQCDRAKITQRTRDVLLTTEGINDIKREVVETAMSELVTLVGEFCGGEVWSTLLDRNHPWAASE